MWLKTVTASVKDSLYFQQLEEKMAKNEVSGVHYKEVDGAWYFKDRIMLDPDSDLCMKIFLDHQATPSGGHSRYQHTIHRIKHSFWWS